MLVLSFSTTFQRFVICALCSGASQKSETYTFTINPPIPQLLNSPIPQLFNFPRARSTKPCHEAQASGFFVPNLLRILGDRFVTLSTNSLGFVLCEARSTKLVDLVLSIHTWLLVPGETVRIGAAAMADAIC